MPNIDADELKDFSIRLLQAGSFTASEARQMADLLVWANLRGVDSHGVLRIPRYIEMVEQGIITTGTPVEIVRKYGAIAVLDCGKSPGAVGMNAAVEQAETLARQHGIGWSAARSITHAGAIGYFAAILAERGLLSLVMTASRPLMNYFGAKGDALSTNPLAIGAPGAENTEPLLLDMSTAAVALGKIMAAKDAGQPIPPGWGVDADGNETTDPHRVSSMLPMAGPKGSGLSLMIEVLTSVLAGSPIIAPFLMGRGKGAFNGVVIAIDPTAFAPLEDFTAGIEDLRAAIHALEPANPNSAVLLPGERGALVARERLVNGIPIPQGTARRLAETAAQLGVACPPILA